VAEHERKRIRFEDEETNVLHAVWSRSGKLLLHVTSPESSESRSEARMHLTPDQVESLERFLENGH
jgi:hypothetical protein